MFQKLKDNLLPSSKIAVAIVTAVLFVLGVIQVAQGFIDTHNYRDQFIQIVKEKTGKTITIKGKVSISLLPTPTIYIPGVELRDIESTSPIPSLSVNMIRLSVPLAAVFSDRPQVSAITLQQPVLDVERSHDNLIHWDWLNASLIKALANDTNAEPPALNINDGEILYHDDRNDKTITIENLNASIAPGSHLGAKGSFTNSGHTISFNFTTNGVPASGADIVFSAQLHANKDSLEWQGILNLSADVPKITGKFDLALENALTWANAPASETRSSFGDITNQFSRKEEKKSVLPIKISGEWAEDGLAIAMNNIQLDGLNSAGAGKATLTWKGWQPSLACDMHFSALDYNAWQTLLAALFIDKGVAQDYTEGDEQAGNPLPKDMQATLAITADQLTVGTQSWKNAKLAATLANAALTVNQFNIQLPGDSTLTLFGIIAQGATNDMRFEGSMETAGKSLRQALTAFTDSATDLPDMGFGAFSARSNLFVSAEQVRLSEADVKLNDLAVHGGLAAYFDAHPRLEADVKLKDINFDYFRNVWREKQKASRQQDFFLKFDKGMNFNWLKNLQTSIDFKVNVDGFTFMERKGNSASFRIFVKSGEFGLYDVKLNYPEDVMSGSFNLNVQGQQPLINVILNANAIDMGYFISSPAAPPAATPIPVGDAGKKRWPESLIDTSWMEGYNGAFDLSIGKLTYDKTILNHVNFQAKLDNNMLAFKNFTFDYWQGKCSVLGSVYGGEVPGSSISFMLYDVDLHDMLKDLTGRDNITGNASVSGTLTTAGINFLSWVSQGDVKLVLAARGVNVTGLNLQGVVDATAIARTAADVFNNVNQALVNGSTELTVDGNINVKNGIMRTPGITLKSGTIIGDLTGEVRLVPWTMDLSTLFQFPAMTSETIPTMTVQLSGPIETPQLKTDTSSLEAYVAKRIIIK